MSSTARDPVRRIVLLGASNLTRGMATALATLRRGCEGPLDVLAANGNGRSYGHYSRVLIRGLPSILECGLWDQLARRPRLPTSALITDIGNDVMYGAEVSQILSWIEECLRRLQAYDARIVLTGLPIANLARIQGWQYYTLRTLFFPQNRDDLPTAASRSQAVDAGVRKLAERYGATFVEPETAWYGFDPIHFRRAHWPTAWHRFVGGFGDRSGDVSSTATESDLTPEVSLWNTLAAQCWAPQERRLLGIVQRRVQPAVTLTDGTRISIF